MNVLRTNALFFDLITNLTEIGTGIIRTMHSFAEHEDITKFLSSIVVGNLYWIVKYCKKLYIEFCSLNAAE